MEITLDRPWMVVDLGRPHRVLSWSLTRPGFVDADQVVWREVRDADLGPDLDARAWLAEALETRGQGQAVGLLTSRDLSTRRMAEAEIEDVRACCLATVGLSNAERVGTRRTMAKAGTINTLVTVSEALTDGALVEALSLCVAARTAAVMDHGPRLGTGRATGTGTDCAVIAAPPGDTPYAGMHTAVGEAIGRAVYAAVAEGVQEWMRSFASER
ncbi:MAG: adenosylcobinamide amidohydrolase [Pseudomonadota bacterium]